MKRKIKALEAINIAHEVGVGEIIVNNINLDGTWRGFDIDLLKKIVERSSVPIVALGGAGSLNDIKEVLKHSFVSAVGIGSMAVFQSKGMGVLIKYPRLEEIEKIIKAL